MSAEEVLKNSEKLALGGGSVVSHVNGKNLGNKKAKGLKSFGAAGFITVMIIVFAVIFGSGSLIPSAISERLIEETDVQYADAVKSKEIVFQQALYNGQVPEDTAKNLKDNGVLVGYLEDGEFVESNQSSNELVLKMQDTIIAADNFINEVDNNIELYDAFTEATYSRAAYYYDDSAKEVFKEIGTSRDNYTEDSDFDDVMDSKVGKGSDISVNSVSLVKKSRVNEQSGKEETYYEYEENGESANSSEEADVFIKEVGEKNSADSVVQSTLNSADTLKVADTISKEQRSSLFYLTFMENISKMKAGEGSESKINEAMQYLYEKAVSQVVDVKTGQIVESEGTALESPSLYAILAGEKVNADDVANYSSDRIIKTVENQVGVKATESIKTTVASSAEKIKGAVGRLLGSGSETASKEVLDLVKPTVDSSLVNNSYSATKGINAGELLVEGAVNVGAKLARKSGATPGDMEAITEYARMNTKILAMDAEINRRNRSPFDITSKDTFLGSIIYRFAISQKNSPKTSWLSSVNSLKNVVVSSINTLSPSSYADEVSGYLDSFGDCETYETMLGAVGSAQCAENATFDTTTLNNPFNDEGFVDFIEANTTLNSNGEREVNKDSALADFIKYSVERTTSLGIIDGGILESIKNSSSSISFTADIAGIVELSTDASEHDKRIATGAAFVNSGSNPDWEKNKYAQRYVSLARAVKAMKQHSDDSSAYNNIRYFEGDENPVTAFLREYYAYK